MRPNWRALSESDQSAYRVVSAFLKGRLEERATIDWALRIQPHEHFKRLAILDLLDTLDGVKISDPWKTGWRLIEESWEHPKPERHGSTQSFYAVNRLRHGERSNSLVGALVNLVAPHLNVESFSRLDLKYSKLPRRPKKVEDLFKVGLGSGSVMDPDELRIAKIVDVPFLLALAQALEAAIVSGFNAVRLIGKDWEARPWLLGQLNRVYFIPKSDRPADEHEPDEFHTGIAPSTKLLYSVVNQVKSVHLASAIEFSRRWKETSYPIYVRLWSALARDPRIESPKEIGNKLLAIDDRVFWTAELYPEIAELRALRFGELEPEHRSLIVARLREGPPKSIWRRRIDSKTFQRARRKVAATELRRIQVSGGKLSSSDQAWLDKSIDIFPELTRLERPDAGFLGTPKMKSVDSKPDSRFDALSGESRLKELETALSSRRDVWSELPTRGADDWIRVQGNTSKVMLDMEEAPEAGGDYYRVWERFGWSHSPGKDAAEKGKSSEDDSERERVLMLLARLPDATIRLAIDGISHWMSTWLERKSLNVATFRVWMRIWPTAVEATNKLRQVDDERSLEAFSLATEEPKEDEDFDTLNPPVGKLVGVFLSACPNLNAVAHPFAKKTRLRQMREAIISTEGRSGLIARHRLIESLPYFLRADPQWTEKHLVSPLIKEGNETVLLWRAVGRQIRFTDVLEILGNKMAEHATDTRLNRQTRDVLVLSLIVECLHALREKREPAVPYNRVQQMIRSLTDESRANAANVMRRFVVDVSGPVPRKDANLSPEKIYRASVVPFLNAVWPQERSLSRAGVSKAFAHLPAAVGDEFADAVALVERFLVPFECWTMMDFGFRIGDGEKSSLGLVNNQKKANALLLLLDRSIGTAEGSTVPHELAEVLEHIRKVAPRLAERMSFRRLAAAARRG